MFFEFAVLADAASAAQQGGQCIQEAATHPLVGIFWGAGLSALIGVLGFFVRSAWKKADEAARIAREITEERVNCADNVRKSADAHMQQQLAPVLAATVYLQGCMMELHGLVREHDGALQENMKRQAERHADVRGECRQNVDGIRSDIHRLEDRVRDVEKRGSK